MSIGITGLLMAMDLILSNFFKIQTPINRISFGFLPSALIGSLFGPLIGGIAGVLTDLVGIFLFSSGTPFFPGFTLSALLGSMMYGFFLHRKEIKLHHVVTVVLLNTLFVNLFLNTLWIRMLQGEAWRVLLPIRILQNVVVAPIRIALIYFVLNQPSLKRTFQKYRTSNK